MLPPTPPIYSCKIFRTESVPVYHFYYSNLTFGAGGKDKDGKNVVGWGYYEVRSLKLPSSMFSFDVNSFR